MNGGSPAVPMVCFFPERNVLGQMSPETLGLSAKPKGILSDPGQRSSTIPVMKI